MPGSVSSPEIISTWDTQNKIQSIKIIENGVLLSTETLEYKYSSLLQQYLLSKSTMIEEGIFDNGDCYQSITITSYTNYGTRCDLSRHAKGEESVDKNAQISKLKLIPNPASEFIRLELPYQLNQAVLFVYNKAGQTVHQRKLTNQDQLYLNINFYPPGMYFVKVVSIGETFNSNFIKQ